MDEFLTMEELAKRWKIALNTLQKWNAQGKDPKPIKINSRVRYRLADIIAFEERQNAESGDRK